MRQSRRFRPSPATVLAGLALFFALGGSAFAISSAAQPRCAAGAVRGIAVVTGDPRNGMAAIPDRFTTNGAFFQRKFNCSGGAVMVRRAGSTGVYEVRFAGNTAPDAVANVYTDGGGVGSVLRQPDGSFRVFVRGSATEGNKLVPLDVAFSVIAI